MKLAIVAWIIFQALMVRADSAAPSTLEDAYKKEYAHLLRQKKELEDQFRRLDQEKGQLVKELSRDISRLQNQYTSLVQNIDQQTSELEAAERNKENEEQQRDLLTGTLEQSFLILEEFGFEREEDSLEGQLKGRFQGGLSLLRKLNSVTRQNQSFFDSQGEKVEGEVLSLGQLVSWSLRPGAAGLLGPAGGQELKLLTEVDSDQLEESLRSGRPVPTFLMGPRGEEVETPQEKTFLTYMEAAGPVGWFLVFLGGVSTVLVVRRFILLRNIKKELDTIPQAAIALELRAGRLKSALGQLSPEPKGIHRIFEKVLVSVPESHEKFNAHVQESLLKEGSTFDRFGPAILVIASVAPLLGLLGTVTGMIATFEVLTQFGTGNPKLLSGGISEALTTTDLGLKVAIPSLLLGQILNSWSQKLKNSTEAMILSFVNSYEPQPKKMEAPRYGNDLSQDLPNFL